MKTRKKGLWVLPLAALLAGIFFLSFLIGRYRVPALQVLRLLTDRFLSLISFGRWGLAPTWTAEEASVVVQIRLPRILSAALIGAALSAAGTSYQAMFRNPMVSPDLLGASTGACFGAALAILLGASYAVITASSFLFGLAAVGLTYLVGRLSRIRSTLAMVLAGMMVGSLFSAGTSFIKLVADTTDQLPPSPYWLMGAIDRCSFRRSALCHGSHFVRPDPTFFSAVAAESSVRQRGGGPQHGRQHPAAAPARHPLRHAGDRGERLHQRHDRLGGARDPAYLPAARRQDTQRLLPCSMLLGASFLMLVDDLARCLAASEIPLGILTAFVGAPLFLYLIVKGGRRHDAD